MDVRKLSTQELLRRCLESDDPLVWQEFVRRFQPMIARVVLKTLTRQRYWKRPTPQEIDDLVQDTFLKLCANDFRALRNFEWQHENGFYGFLKKVASNVVLDHLRKRTPDEEDEEKGQNIPSSGAGAPGTVERNILIGEIQRCLERQSADENFARDCVIFRLYYQQGLTAKAISELPGIGLTVKGVESTLLRLIRLIRECMGRGPENGRAAGAPG